MTRIFNWKVYGSLNAGEKGLVDWQLQRPVGGFQEALWRAIYRADSENLKNLAAGFPEQVEAYERFSGESGWWSNLQNRLYRETDDV